MSVERAEQLEREIGERLAELVQLVRDRPAVDVRRHWVFTNPCGCAFGVQDAGDAAGSSAERAAAWAYFYEGAALAGFAAVERGAKLVIVDHARYLEHFRPHLESGYQCPHGGTT